VRRYYIVGVPGAGKTTVRRQITGVTTIAEWLDPPPEEMALPSPTLNDRQAETIDQFVVDQVAKKDLAAKEQVEGVVVIDRSPIDAAVFPKKGQTQREKAIEYARALETRRVEILDGSVIYLSAAPTEIAARLTKKRGTQSRSADPVYDLSRLASLNDACLGLYAHPNTKVIPTTGRTVREIVFDVARFIYREEYRPVELKKLLERAQLAPEVP
jgi:hypothetical protein